MITHNAFSCVCYIYILIYIYKHTQTCIYIYIYIYIYIHRSSIIVLQIMHNKKRRQEFMTPNLSQMLLSIQQGTQILQVKNYLFSHPFYKIWSSDNLHCVKRFRYDPKVLRRHHVYKFYHIKDPVYRPLRNVYDLSQHNISQAIY